MNVTIEVVASKKGDANLIVKIIFNVLSIGDAILSSHKWWGQCVYEPMERLFLKAYALCLKDHIRSIRIPYIYLATQVCYMNSLSMDECDTI